MPNTRAQCARLNMRRWPGRPAFQAWPCWSAAFLVSVFERCKPLTCMNGAYAEQDARQCQHEVVCYNGAVASSSAADSRSSDVAVVQPVAR